VATASYQVDPPSGGDHLTAPASAGAYQVGNVPVDGNLVHALEHGFVILWHHPNVAGAQRDRLLDIAEPYEQDVLVGPAPPCLHRSSLPPGTCDSMSLSAEPTLLSRFI
jgi:hypothetical protein